MIFPTVDGETPGRQVRPDTTFSISFLANGEIAYGEIDGYGVSLHVSIPQAIKLWKYPVSSNDISEIFRRHITGELEAIPWSEEDLNEETKTIRGQLLKLISKGWWSVASQPAVNGVKSTDSVYGWGPKNGYVFQKV